MLKRLRDHTVTHRNKIAEELNSMFSFLLRKVKYRWPQVKRGFRAKSFPHVVLLLSTSRIQLVLHPQCHFSLLSPSGWQSLTGGSPDPLAAPMALAVSCLSSDPHTSTFPAGRHVQDDTVGIKINKIYIFFNYWCKY